MERSKKNISKTFPKHFQKTFPKNFQKNRISLDRMQYPDSPATESSYRDHRPSYGTPDTSLDSRLRPHCPPPSPGGAPQPTTGPRPKSPRTPTPARRAAGGGHDLQKRQVLAGRGVLDGHHLLQVVRHLERALPRARAGQPLLLLVGLGRLARPEPLDVERQVVLRGGGRRRPLCGGRQGRQPQQAAHRVALVGVDELGDALQPEVAPAPRQLLGVGRVDLRVGVLVPHALGAGWERWRRGRACVSRGDDCPARPQPPPTRFATAHAVSGPAPQPPVTVAAAPLEPAPQPHPLRKGSKGVFLKSSPKPPSTKKKNRRTGDHRPVSPTSTKRRGYTPSQWGQSSRYRHRYRHS